MTNRWVALTIIFLSFIQFTLNWFCIIPAFGDIATEMRLSFSQVGLIVGVFIAGYGLAHIPGGWLAERYGMRTAILAGIAIETVGAGVTGWAPSYEMLLAGRLLCGIGGSVYIGSAVGLTAAWFHDRELALANSIITGIAFTVGAAIGLFGWGLIVAALGWREAIAVGAGVGVVTLAFMLVLFPTPQNGASDVVQGKHLGMASLRRVFGSRILWLMGLAFLGGYGSYFSAAQLLPHYAQARLGLSAAAAEQISVILLLSGVPGAFIGGWLVDRLFGIVPVFFAACSLEGIALILVPHLGLTGLEVAAAVIGSATITAFVVWISIPGQQSHGFQISDVPTAVGLMLTIVAVGGAVIPPLYSMVTTSWSFGSAWAFEGVASIGFATIAFLAQVPSGRAIPPVSVSTGSIKQRG